MPKLLFLSSGMDRIDPSHENRSVNHLTKITTQYIFITKFYNSLQNCFKPKIKKSSCNVDLYYLNSFVCNN